MKPKRLCSIVSALFLAVFLLFSGALPAKAAAAFYEPANYVLISAGEFTMGSPVGEAGRWSNETQHQVRLSSFSIGKYEVTVAEFRRFVEATGYRTDAETRGGVVIPNCNQIDLNIQSQPVKDRRPSGCSSIFFSPLAACAITAPRVSNT